MVIDASRTGEDGTQFLVESGRPVLMCQPLCDERVTPILKAEGDGRLKPLDVSCHTQDNRCLHTLVIAGAASEPAWILLEKAWKIREDAHDFLSSIGFGEVPPYPPFESCFDRGHRYIVP